MCAPTLQLAGCDAILHWQMVCLHDLKPKGSIALPSQRLRPLIGTLLWLLLLGSLGGCPDKGPCQGARCDGGVVVGACLADLDCHGGEVCEQGVCVSARRDCSTDTDCGPGARCEALTGRCVSSAGCQQDVDCPSPQRCDLSTHSCISNPGCSQDLDCAPPQALCNSGRCVAGCGVSGTTVVCSGTELCSSSTGRCVPPGGCGGDSDCGPPDRICEAASCILGCRANGCNAGFSCNMGTGRCETLQSCQSDTDCGAPVSICHAGACIDGCTPGGCGTDFSCNQTTGRCQSGAGGGCLTDTNCSPPATICNAGSCTPGCASSGCTAPSTCNGSGRCAGPSGCSSNADCSAPFPLCQGGTCIADGSTSCVGGACPATQLCDPYVGSCEAKGSLALGATCTRHKDCADDYCIVLGDGIGRCSRACSSTEQCPLEFNCYALPPPGASLCIHESLIGKNYGTSPMGTACSGTVNTCHSGMCLTLVGACTDSCQQDRDCQSGDACSLLIGDFDGNGVDELRTICMPRGFGGTTGDACTANSQCMRGNCMGTAPGAICADPCCSSRDCPTGFACQPVQRAGASGLIRACGALPPTGSAPVGAACNLADNTPCRAGWCFEDKQGAPPYCTDTCCTNADCPSGFRCISELFDLNNDGTFDLSQPLCERR